MIFLRPLSSITEFLRWWKCVYFSCVVLWHTHLLMTYWWDTKIGTFISRQLLMIIKTFNTRSSYISFQIVESRAVGDPDEQWLPLNAHTHKWTYKCRHTETLVCTQVSKLGGGSAQGWLMCQNYWAATCGQAAAQADRLRTRLIWNCKRVHVLCACLGSKLKTSASKCISTH